MVIRKALNVLTGLSPDGSQFRDCPCELNEHLEKGWEIEQLLVLGSVADRGTPGEYSVGCTFAYMVVLRKDVSDEEAKSFSHRA